MARKYIDCRDLPSESQCSLYISGTEDEVVAAAAQHAIAKHGHPDTPDLAGEMRAALKDER